MREAGEHGTTDHFLFVCVKEDGKVNTAHHTVFVRGGRGGRATTTQTQFFVYGRRGANTVFLCVGEGTITAQTQVFCLGEFRGEAQHKDSFVLSGRAKTQKR